MKIAVAQISCSLGDPEANVSKVRDFSRQAKEAGAEHLIATHFSSRYDGRQIVQIGDEAREIFEKITVGRDLLEVDL